MEEELVTVHRTEAILKGRLNNLDQFLQEMETKRGVKGFFETQDKLDLVSERTLELNEAKGQTLEEMGRVVSEINGRLQERKVQLAPAIKQLREVRQGTLLFDLWAYLSIYSRTGLYILVYSDMNT